jgi:oligoendopeptidase F
MYTTRAPIILVSCISTAVLPAPTIQSSAAGVVWDLPTVYPDEASWAADRDKVLESIEPVRQLAGRARRSANELADVLDAVHALRARAGKMARFAILNRELDSASADTRSRFEAATSLEARVEEAVGFLATDVLSISRARLEKWRKAEPRLAAHRLRLNEILTRAAHSARPEVEAVLAAMMRWPQTTSDVANQLLEADLGWPSIRTPDGAQAVVDPRRFEELRRSADPSVRRAANDAYFGRLRSFEAVFGLLATRRIEADLAIARARGFSDPIDAGFARNDNLPAGLYREVLEQARARTDIPIRLARLLKRVSGAPSIGFGDLRFLPISGARKIPLAEAKEITFAAVAPLGPDYQARLRARLAQPWMHLAPGENKARSVGVYWGVGGGHPYAIMTYLDDLGSSRVFASSAMLLMDYADLPPGFVPDLRSEDQPVHGNVIWTAARLLHDEVLLRKIADRKERAALRVAGVQYLWRAFQTYAIATDLERSIAVAIQSGKPMTGEEISRTQLALARAYAGSKDGGVAVEESFAQEWITQDNLFYGGAHAVFAVCAVGAAALVEKLRAGDGRAVAGLSRGLSRARSLYSHDLLLDMGIDLTDRSSQQAIFRRMSAEMEAAERELDGQL